VRRVLIVNADDLGQSEGVNRGVLQAVERGIVTSASLMVRWPAAVEAARRLREHPHVSLGLHVDLGEWEYRDGVWEARYAVVPLEDADQVAAEVARQLDRFHELVGSAPTHLDSHQHVHLAEPVRSLLVGVAGRLGVPLRGTHPTIRHCGDFYGQTGTGEPLPELITVEALLRIIAGLPDGVTELGCHPGDGPVDSVYGPERSQELRVLCDDGIRSRLRADAIELRSFRSALR
jgi:predicted glycoside hydrolase/deacetylase ChbG (UPF0249 family)